MNFQQLRKISLEFRIDGQNDDWFIYAGPNRYLVAEGPAFTTPFGKEILYTLMDGRAGVQNGKSVFVEAIQVRRSM